MRRQNGAIYTPKWELLTAAAERVASTHGDLEASKTAICDAIADRKIGVRVTINQAHHRHGGQTFPAGNVEVPVRLNPGDFEWVQSRPLRDWRIGPQRGEHYAWIGGWEPEPIGLIELLRSDVSAVLKCDDSPDAEVISYADAKARLCKIKFGEDYIPKLSGHEEYILDVGWGIDVGMIEWDMANAKAKRFDYQQDWADDWLETRRYIDEMRALGQPISPFSHAAFELDLYRDFPEIKPSPLERVQISERAADSSDEMQGVSPPDAEKAGRGQRTRQTKSAPKSEAIIEALRKHGYERSHPGKTCKEIANEIESDVVGGFGSITQESRAKRVERALKKLKNPKST